MPDNSQELSLDYTPTWSVACVLTVFVAVSLTVEHSIHRVCNWLKSTGRKPLLASVEKMKEELMLLGFISLLLTTTSSMISNICISSKLYDSVFTPCPNYETNKETESDSKVHRLLMSIIYPHSNRRMLKGLNRNSCPENFEPFVSYEGLEQLHRFIFVMTVTHMSYSCLTMLLALVKVYGWREWEIEAHLDRHNSLSVVTRALTMKRQSTFVRFDASNPTNRNMLLIWVICFFRQFGNSVVHIDYLTLRQGFIMNHNLNSKYDFHSYMIRSMEEEFQSIVGVSAPLWGFVVAFMLFNIEGSSFYFWIALIPTVLVLFVGAKLEHIIATLALESAEIRGTFSASGSKFKLRDELFWFNKPKLLLSLIHFILFQNAFELASFFWFWWQFGYNSCFIKSHFLVYLRLILGFAGQLLCSYSTLPLYALATQMGTNYKAALLPQTVRETIHGWGKETRRRRRRRRFGVNSADDSRSRPSTVRSLEEDGYADDDDDDDIDDDDELLDSVRSISNDSMEIELQPPTIFRRDSHSGAPLLRASAHTASSGSSQGIKQRSASLDHIQFHP